MERRWDEIFNFLSWGGYPAEMTKSQRQTLRKYASKFSIHDGILYFGKTPTRRAVKSKEEAVSLFQFYHSTFKSRHTGIIKTRASMCKSFFWNGITTDIEKWVSECEECSQIRPKLKIIKIYSGQWEGKCEEKTSVRCVTMAAEEEFFAGIPKIQYVPNAGPGDVMCFKHYHAEEVLLGKTMEDWLRFSVCYWHTFCGTGADPFGLPTFNRSWNEKSPMKAAKRRLRGAFEFFTKLGVKYYTFHDRDMAPEGATLEESNKNLDEIIELALKLQNQTGVKVLWVTCNLFAHPRYMNGAATNPDCHVLAYAGAQVKKGLEIAKKLGAENFVFWGGREGFISSHNTDVAAELSHMANFFKMAVKYKEKIGLKCQFLIEPKPKEPCKHQYDYDAMSVIGFLKHYSLESHFKLNIEPNHTTLAGHAYEHDIIMASVFGMLGSVDANTGSPDLGWDTDQFPMDIKHTTLVMKTIVEQGGLQPGGLNFDAKVRRESVDPEDLFIAHIGAMDAFARGLRNAISMCQDGILANMLKERYSSFSHGIGLKVEEGSATLEDMEAFIKENGEAKLTSGKQEKYESIFNYYVK